MPDEFSGPHICAAFLCEKVLQEKDNVVSFIRVVDRFVRPKPMPPEVPVIPIQGMLVIAFKAGGIGTGKFSIKIRIYKPNALTHFIEVENEVFFEGGQDQGVNAVSPFGIVPDEEGLYWIDVLFEERLITRIPLRVIFASVPTIQQQPHQPGA